MYLILGIDLSHRVIQNQIIKTRIGSARKLMIRTFQQETMFRTNRILVHADVSRHTVPEKLTGHAREDRMIHIPFQGMATSNVRWMRFSS